MYQREIRVVKEDRFNEPNKKSIKFVFKKKKSVKEHLIDQYL